MPKGEAKHKAMWWVLTEKDGLLSKLYSGSDKKRAREVAAKNLSDQSDSKDEPNIVVVRIDALTVLNRDDLKPVLPKDAF